MLEPSGATAAPGQEKNDTICTTLFFFVFFPPTSAVVGAPLIQQHTREYLAPAAVEGVPGCPQLTADGRAEEWGGCRAALSRPAPRWL